MTDITQIINDIVINHAELKINIPVWGTTYEENNKKTGFTGLLIPTKGIICHTDHKSTYERDTANKSNMKPDMEWKDYLQKIARWHGQLYFVPLKKNAKSNEELAWSKTRSIYGVFFTKTEKESWLILSILMKNIINKHTQRIQELYDRQKEIITNCNLIDQDISLIIQYLKTEADNYKQMTSQTDSSFEQYIKDYMTNKGITT